MKRRILSLALVFSLLLALIPAVLPVAIAAAETFNPSDKAIINAIIANNGLKLTPAALNDSAPPEDWTWVVFWSYHSTDRRVTSLMLNGRDLTGTLDVSGLDWLNLLWCNHNQLTGLNVSGAPALQFLLCNDNLLTELDVSKNTALTELNCSFNLLTELDVSKNTALKELWCGNNWLTSLKVSGAVALEILECTRNLLTELDVSTNTALKKLLCSHNRLSSLDVSKNTVLEQLDCRGYLLTSLDVSRNTALTELYVGSNRLTTLDVSRNTALKSLTVNGRLSTLDVSKNLALEKLNCVGNELTTLDVSKNTALTELDVQFNLLTELNVSHNAALRFLDFRLNNLSAIDISKNTALTTLYWGGNRMSHVTTANNPALTDFQNAVGLDFNEIYNHNRVVYDSKRTDQAALDYYKQLQGDYSVFTALASEITKGITDDYYKAVAIHCWVACNIWYDWDMYDMYANVAARRVTAEETLQYRRSVCDGYARLTVALLRAAGIPAKHITGWLELAGEGHAWPEAYIDGRWVIMDTTWGSLNRYASGEYSPQRTCYLYSFDKSLKRLSVAAKINDYSEDHIPLSLDPLSTASPWAHTYINTALGHGIIPTSLQNNYTRNTTRAEFAALAVLLYETATGRVIPTEGNPFTDTTDINAVKAAAIGVTTGTTPTTFTPDRQLNREEAAAMLSRLAVAIGKPLPDAAPDFTDGDRISNWATGYVGRVQAEGIMGGSGGRFTPQDPYTREQSITTMVRMWNWFNR